MVSRFPTVALFASLILFPASAGLAASPSSEAAYAFLLAGTLLADGETEGALAAYAEAAKLAPRDPYVRLEYATALGGSGRLPEAAVQIRQAREIAPDDLEVMRTQARIAMGLAEHDEAARGEAQQALERVLAAEPDDLTSLITLGQIYLEEQDAQRALAVLDRADELRPGQPMIEGLRVRALILAGDAQGC